MSVRFESANSENASVAGFWGGDTACAFGVWVYFVSLPSSGNAGIVTFEGAGFTGVELQVTSGGNLRFYTQNTGGGTTGSASISTATWYYLWVRRDGTGFGGTWNVYVDGSTTADITRNDSFGDGTLTLAEGVVDSSAFTNVRLLNFKAWDADLAASNANTEKADCDHQSTTNAFSEYLLDDHTTDLADEGPGTRDLTASGTLSTEANTGDWSCGGAATVLREYGVFLEPRVAARVPIVTLFDAHVEFVEQPAPPVSGDEFVGPFGGGFRFVRGGSTVVGVFQ